MLDSILTATTYALALALACATLLVAVPRLLFALVPRVSAWLDALERRLEREESSEPPQRPGNAGSTLWPRISGPA